MILIGLGSNIFGPWGSPEETVIKAINCLDAKPIQLLRASTLLSTKPYGEPDQPDFINAVCSIATDLDPAALLRHLHDIELDADRRRSLRWGPRTLDLDILDYHGKVEEIAFPNGHNGVLILPHKELSKRAFVLTSIAEIAPNWHHPILQKNARQLLKLCPDG